MSDSVGPIRTPDQRVRVFVSSTLQELADERAAVRAAILQLHLAPVMFELGARPHPPRDLYRAYLDQSHIFIGIYWQKYGWVAPGETISGLEDEYRLSGNKPKLIYLKSPAPDQEPRLDELLDRIRKDDTVSYKPFTTAAELRELIENDLMVLLTERFEAPVERSLPTGTVSFLFTDIEGSTDLARQYPAALPALLAQHHTILRESIEANHGHIFQIIGDAFCAAFSTAWDALQAALDAQRRLQHEAWQPAPIKVRMGLHTGAAQAVAGDDHAVGYAGYLTLSCVQRVMAAAHGGQVLLSNATAELLHGQLPDGVSLRDMQSHHLKGLPQPEHLWQLVAADITQDFPSLKSLTTLPNNLPVQLTSFVGREKELADVKRLLHDAHILSLIGPGGTGKTRLSIQAASEVLDQYSDGVWLVELAPVLDAQLVPRATAIAIGLRDEPQRPVIDMLCDYLHEKKMLVLLDNCEHVVDACAQLADRILRAAPDVRILATSREALGITGEVTYRVPSLGLPDVDHLPPLDSLSQYEAVKLFIDRAVSAVSTFTVTNDNAPALAQICNRLDGIPLAIELAAAKIRVLSLEQIAKRLDDRFRFLTGGNRTALERHQTLRATIDWSYNLLQPAEQALFRRLAIFVGGWTLEAAEAVCGDSPAAPGKTTSLVHSDDVLDVLERLINKSIVVKEDSQPETRYRLLETMRQYANEKLVESDKGDEVDLVRHQHAQYYLNFVTFVEPLIRSAERVRWQQVMQGEFGNIRAVFEWICKTGKFIEIGEQIATRIGWFWVTNGHSAEGQQWCNQLMEMCDESTPAAIRAGLLYFSSMVGWARGDHIPAVTNLDKGLELLRTLDDKTPEGKRLLANAMIVRGLLATSARDLPTATNFYQMGIELCREIRDQWNEAIALSWLGDIAQHENDRDRAVTLHNQSIQLGRQQGDPWCLMPMLMSTAQISVLDGDLATARPMFLEAEALLRHTGDNWSLTWALNDLGHLARAQDELDQAGVYFLEALSLGNTLGNQRVLIVALAGAAALIARRSNELPHTQGQNTAELIKAAHLCGATAPYIDAPGAFVWFDTKKLYDEAILQAKSLMDADLWDKAYGEGQSLLLDQAVDLAMQALKG